MYLFADAPDWWTNVIFAAAVASTKGAGLAGALLLR
jgi:hypothetical protein